MGLFSKLFGGDSARNDGTEQALLIGIAAGPAVDGAFLARLGSQLTAAVTDSGDGKPSEGDPVDAFTSFGFAGPDADALFDAAAPVIEQHPLPKGSHAIKRYGGPGCPRTERIDIAWDG